MSDEFTRHTYAPLGVLCVQREALGIEFLLFAGDRTTCVEDGVAIITIAGPLMHHSNPILDSYDAITTRVREALANDDVADVALRIHSPGGDASGITEAHRKILEMRASTTKRVCAFVDELAASAAYYLAAACEEIWLPPAAEVGSIGAIAELEDRTLANERAGILREYIKTGARKDDSRPDRPLTDEVRAAVQKRIDHVGDLFFADVGKARKLSVETVSGYEAGMFSGEGAVEAKLADGVASWSKFLALVKKSRATVNSSEADSPAPEAPMDLLSLVKAKEAATAAVIAAKTEAERKAAMIAFDSAATALAQATVQGDRPLTTLAALAAASDDDDDDDEDDEDEGEKKAKAEEERKAKAEEERKASERHAEKKKMLRAKMKAAKTEETKAKYRAKLKKMDEDEEERKAQAALGSTANSDVELLKAQVAALTRQRETDTKASRAKEVHAMLLAASHEGKLTPAMIPEMREVGLESPERLQKLLSAMPKMNAEVLPHDGAPDGISTQVRTDAGIVDLKAPQNEDQKRILASMTIGMTKDQKDQLDAAMKIAQDNAHSRAANGGIPRA